MRTLIACAVLVVGSGPLRADGWLVAEAPAALAISEAPFGGTVTGVMPALGLYTDNGTSAIGLRLRAGILRSAGLLSGRLSDLGLGGFGTVGLAVRFGAHGVWIEGVAGGGLEGHDLVSSVEAGLGWQFSAGPVDLGPSVRFLYMASRSDGDAMAGPGSTGLLLVGFDVRFGRTNPSRPPPALIAAAVAPVAPVAADEPPQPAVDRDPDGVADRDASCATESEGCELTEIDAHDGRLVIDEHALFHGGSAHVTRKGRKLIAQIVKTWASHPEWRRLSLEGHADARGSDAYNLALSLRRADRARDVFLRLGVKPSRMAIVGHGRARPLDPSTSEAAYQRNRRVEFVFVFERAAAR